MEQDVRNWAEDAKTKLVQAQDTGSKADFRLKQTRSMIKQSNDSLIKGNFMLDSINQQLHLLETIFESIELNIEDKVQSVDILSNYLSNTAEELETTFDELKGIKVDESLSITSQTLYDFVSNEALDDLKLELTNINQNFEQSHQTLDDVLRSIRSQLNEFNIRYTNLDREVTSVTNSTWIGEVVEENNKLEEELASLIESITNHYDQCSKGIGIIEGEVTDVLENDIQEFFSVLSKDFDEVPEVISDIEEVYADIDQRCKKIEQFLQSKNYEELLRELSTELTDFGERTLTEAIAILTKQTSLFQDKTIEINEKCDEANELIRHYQKFVRSYYSLILELSRRKTTQDAMKKIVNETNAKLQSLQEEDYRFRKSFMSNNGPFLPGNLWSGFNDESPLIQTAFEYSELPEVSKAALNDARSVLSGRN